VRTGGRKKSGNGKVEMKGERRAEIGERERSRDKTEDE
jgi:hypothetical protein